MSNYYEENTHKNIYKDNMCEDDRSCCGTNTIIQPHSSYNPMFDEKYECKIDLPKTLSETKNDPIAFCCDLTIPSISVIDWSTLRIVYDLSCLQILPQTKIYCCESECGPVDITVNSIQVVGCIPYYISVQVVPDPTDPNSTKLCGGIVNFSTDCSITLTDSPKVDICCQGNVCVNSTIACTTQQIDPKNLPPIDCKTIKLTKLGQIEHKNDTVTMPNGTPCTIKDPCNHISIVGNFELNFPKSNPLTCADSHKNAG
ncbi:hypothetical protein [Bacillus cereus]|uniref:hypothetical protein n=1 Tax=Bacillus cereus TaxID=1396 RepID=UPI00374A33BD